MVAVMVTFSQWPQPNEVVACRAAQTFAEAPHVGDAVDSPGVVLNNNTADH